MKNIPTFVIFTLFAFLIASCQESEKSNLTLLSEEVPTDTPLIFGEGVISMGDTMDFAITFSPEMDEIYFTRRAPGERNNIFTSKLVNGSWTVPKIAFLSSEETWEFEPHISPKGDRLYFGSSRPINDSIKSPGLIQWYSQKKDNGWSEPIPMLKPKAPTYMMYLTSSESGNLYFTSEEEGGNPEDGGIYYSNFEDGDYGDIQRMREEINSGKMIAHSYIAPDESYMIFDGEKPSGFGDSDLYISFNKDGIWTKAYNLGPSINTAQTEMAPSVSPDGKYLFFHRGFEIQGENGDSEWLGNIYWVDFRTVKETIERNISSN